MSGMRDTGMQTGRFIVLEGVEGAGKSTVMDAACAFLESRGVPLLRTREPGGTPLAEAVRDLLLAEHGEPVDDLAELLLVFAARAQHLARRIRPALEDGTWVISDRFTDATYAYQGGGRGLPLEHIATLEGLVQGSLRPDCVLVLDLPVEEGLRRARGRGEPDRFEKEQGEFFERVRGAYRERAGRDPGRYRVIDASAPVEQVRDAVESVLDALLGEHGAPGGDSGRG